MRVTAAVCQLRNNEGYLKAMDVELTFKSSLEVRTKKSKGSTRHHTVTRMVLGCDSSLTYSANPIKIEPRECTTSPFAAFTSSVSPSHMGVYTDSCTSLISDFCFSSTESKAVAMKTFFEEDVGKDSLTSWITKHPQNWTKREVLDWVYYVVEQEKLDGSCVKGEAFSNLTGSRLIEMGQEGFLAADPINGLKLYQSFRSLINDVVIEEPKCVPPYSSLDTFNLENHQDIKKLTRDIITGVFGDPQGSCTLNSHACHDVVPGLCKQEGSVQISSYGSFVDSRQQDRTRHSCKPLPLINSDFNTPGGNAIPSGRNAISGSNDLSVYTKEDDQDDKVVALQGLGAYPIDKDFSHWFTLLPPSLGSSSTFPAPVSPVASPPGPQFDFAHPSLTSATSSMTAPTPPSSYKGSLSSPCSSCPSPSPTWFAPQHSPRLFHSPRNSNCWKRQHSNDCTGGADFKHAITSCPAPFSRGLTNTSAPGRCISNPQHDVLQESSPSLPPSSYHLQKTMTKTVCTQNHGGTAPSRQQTQSHTISSSWTFSSTASSTSEQQDNFLLPAPSSTSSSSSPVWHESVASANFEDPSSSYMSTIVHSDSMDDSIFTTSLEEGDMEMDFDPSVTAVSRGRAPRRSRNKSSKTGNHLWEFVRDLLRDPKFNPRLLKWEDKENGVFRFVQSEQVAQLWGEKKNNPHMTYEKLSRAMRFCRKTGFFNAVPRTGKFPKKLCFMFGDKAHGWKD